VSLVSLPTARSLLTSLLAAVALALAVPQLASAGPPPPPETQTNAPGDIPDTQAFVRYRSPDGYSILFPEGWSRTVKRSEVSFRSHFNGERILVRSHAAPARLVHGLAVRMSGVSENESIVGGTRVKHMRFSADSEPDAVTGKTVRLDGAAFVFPHGSRDAIVFLWAPYGSDNADQWNAIAGSFRWR
jgi:hypothetical protein